MTSGGSEGVKTVAVELRFFASAAEAAGRAEERVELPEGTTLAGLTEILAGRGARMAQVIAVCGYLHNAVSARADSSAEILDGDRVDVLPPFAGG